MLVTTENGSHQAIPTYMIDINMILHTVFTMFVDFKNLTPDYFESMKKAAEVNLNFNYPTGH